MHQAGDLETRHRLLLPREVTRLVTKGLHNWIALNISMHSDPAFYILICWLSAAPQTNSSTLTILWFSPGTASWSSRISEEPWRYYVRRTAHATCLVLTSVTYPSHVYGPMKSFVLASVWRSGWSSERKASLLHHHAHGVDCPPVAGAISVIWMRSTWLQSSMPFVPDVKAKGYQFADPVWMPTRGIHHDCSSCSAEQACSHQNVHAWVGGWVHSNIVK